MGLIKDDAILCEERGYGHCDNLVCHECVGNYALKNFIKQNGQVSTCHYCDRKRKTIKVEKLLEPIMSGIRFLYEDAEPYYFEKEYTCPTYFTYDLIHYELSDELKIDNPALLVDISKTIDNNIVWCDANPYSPKEHETELYSWHSFCELVKYKMRYIFYKGRNIVKEYDLSNPVDILEIIDIHIQEGNFVRMLSINKDLYRGRLHQENEDIKCVQGFGPPPKKLAKANRMSAEGIPLFYAAFEAETALKEIDNDSSNYAAIAHFKPKRPLYVLDLLKIKRKKIPSIFDEENRQKRSSILFLKLFAEEISKKIEKAPTIEYVPTQIVTEYFRYVFESKKFGIIDGIVYPSARNESGTCIVLFMDDEDYNDDEKCMVEKDKVRFREYQKNFSRSQIE